MAEEEEEEESSKHSPSVSEKCEFTKEKYNFRLDEDWYINNTYKPESIKHMLKDIYKKYDPKKKEYLKSAFQDKSEDTFSLMKESSASAKSQTFETIIPSYEETTLETAITFDDIDLPFPVEKEDLDKIIEKEVADISVKVERAFRDKHEWEMMMSVLQEHEMAKYLQIQKKKMDKKERIDHEKKEWKKEQASAEDDYVRTMRRDLDNIEARKERKERIYYALRGRLHLDNLMAIKLEETIDETIKNMTDQFSEILLKYSRLIHRHFRFYLRNEQITHGNIKKTESQKSVTILEELKLSHPNVSSVLFGIPWEHCSCHSIATYQARMEEVERLLPITTEKLYRLAETKENTVEELENPDIGLYNIIKRFERFRKFVSRAARKYKKMLDNIEDLMIFELVKVAQKKYPHDFEDDELIAEKSEPCLCELKHYPETCLLDDILWTTDRKIHGVESSSMMSDSYLGGMMYSNNHTIREDFKDMIRRGLTKTHSHDLWEYYFVSRIQDEQSELYVAMDESIKAFSVKNIQSTREIPMMVPIASSILSLRVRDSVYLYKMKQDERRNTFNTRNSVVQDIITKIVNKGRRMSKKVDIFPSEIISTSSTKSLNDLKSSPKNKSKLFTTTDSLILYTSKSNTKGLEIKIEQALENRIKTAVETKESIKSLTKFYDDSRESVQNAPKSERRKSSTIFEQSDEEIDDDELCYNDSILNFIDFLDGILNPKKEPTGDKGRFKQVRMSYVEVMGSDEMNVTFQDNVVFIPELRPETGGVTQIKLPGGRENFLTKPNQLIVVGDPDRKEHLQSKKEFLYKRMDSFTKMIKKYPYLRKYFENYCNIY